MRRHSTPLTAEARAILSGPVKSEAPRAPAAEEKPTFATDVAPWPRPMGEAAFYGLPGRFVRMVEPHTEADRNWLLLVFLVYAGNVLGRNRFFAAGGLHYMRIFAVGVGPTATGRKGSANGPVEDFFKVGPMAPELGHLLTGVSSGEGLIWEIRDAIIRKSKKEGTDDEFEDVVIDPGVDDKRLIVNCGEFQGVLAVMRREGSTVSRIIRDFWDRDLVVAPSKNSPAKTTDCHFSFIGNISREELLQTYQQGDANNGVLNRFLWACSQRSKLLPEGGGLWELTRTEEWSELQKDFNRCSPTEMERVAFDAEAADIWGHNGRPGGLYEALSAARYGLTGAVTYRAAQHVLRLALVYATLDKSLEIRREHLDAALEGWRYCEDSARYIFGSMLEDPAANAILEALRRAPDALTRTDISGLFNRHYTAARLNLALQALHDKGLARFERADTNGRPVELWWAVSKE